MSMLIGLLTAFIAVAVASTLLPAL